MSQHTARQDQRARAEDEDDAYPQARQPERRQGAHLRPPVGQPSGDGDPGPDEPDQPDQPDEREFELLGDNDLGAADLGPAAPGARDPDADSGRIRKINR
jgi:hypothetical protein